MKRIKNISFQFKCDEDWNAMKPCEGGRHCKVCNKTVFDFTDKSLAEYQQQLQKNHGDICGRFSTSQTNSLQTNLSGNSSKWLAVLTLFVSFTSCDDGKQIQEDHTVHQINDQRETHHTIGAPVRDSRFNSDGNIGKVKKPDTKEHENLKDLPDEMKQHADTTKQPSDEYDELGFVDPQPQYLHGGEEGMMEFLSKNISIKDSVFGKVVVGFTVDKNGHMKDANILQSLSPLNDSSILNAIYKLEFEKQKQDYQLSLPIMIEVE